MRRVFLRPAPRFLKTFLESMSHGDIGWWARPFGHMRPLRALAFWMIALRSTAWIQAETLADLGMTTRLQDAMATELNRALDEATEHAWLFGVVELDNSQMLQAVPIAGIGVGTGAFLAGSLGAMLGVLLGAGLAYSAMVRAERARREEAQIEVFGALVHRAMVRVMDPDYQLYDNERRPQ